MPTVYFEELNGTDARFDSDEDGIIYEIGEYFAVFIPSAKYDYRFRNHLWDGKIRFANTRKQTIPVGLKGELQKFCAERDYEFVDTTKENPYTTDSLDGFDDWVQTLNLPFPPRDYQLASAKEAIANKRRIILSVTGSGKSLILFILFRWHMQKGRRVCLIVPNISLVEQMYADFANYGKNDPTFDIENQVQLLYSKKDKNIDESKCLITTWQSLRTYTADVINAFDVIEFDEVHRSKSAEVAKLLKSATDVTIRYGFTGSLSAEPTDNLTIEGTFGPVYTATTTTELQARGELAPLKIYCLTINHTKDDCRYVAKEAKEYQQEIAYLVENDKRNKFIRNMACSLKGVVLVIFKHIEHGHRLYDLIKEKVGDSREVFFIDGSVDDREDIRQAIINGKDAILVASVGTTSTGVNIPNLQHIVLAHPSKSRIQTIQTIGRSLRTHKSKNMAYVYDVIDNLKFGKRRNFVLKHALERFKIYSEQGFDVEFKEVSF